MEPTGQGVILVHRRRVPRFFLRAFKIHVDGSPRGSVRNGRVEKIAVPAGPHEVRVTLDWQGSAPVQVDVPPGGTVNLVCAPTTDPLMVMHVGQRDYESLTLTVAGSASATDW